MKIFNAIAQADLVKLFFDKTGIKLSYLISYNYLAGQAFKLTKEYRSMMDLLALDSGAFSNKTATISEYSLYLGRYGNLYDVSFNLDNDFDDPDHNWRNQVYLEHHLPVNVQKPIPVIHDPKDPFGEFEMFYKDYPYVAIGSNKKLEDEVFKKFKEKYPDLGLHMFGTLDRQMLITHKPYSVDATSYAKQAEFGVILWWRPEEQKEYRIYVGERDRKDDKLPHFKQFEHQKELEEFLQTTFKYTYTDLLTSYQAKMMVNFYFMHQLEGYINSLTP